MPQTSYLSIVISWLINTPPLLAFLFYMHRRYKHTLGSKTIFFSLLFKLFCAIGIGLVYKHYYSDGDTYSFFRTALYYKTQFQHSFTTGLSIFLEWQGLPEMEFHIHPRALIVSRIIFLINLITLDNYWITSMYITILGVLPIFIFCETLLKSKTVSKFTLTVFLLTPSFIFWSSGLLKEGLTVPLFFLILTYIIKTYQKQKLTTSLHLVTSVAFVFLFLIKYYIAAILLPFAVSLIISNKLTNSESKKKIIFTFTSIALIAIASLVHPNLNWHNFMNVLVQNYEAFSKITPTPFLVTYKNLSPSLTSFLINSPQALTNAFFRPHILEVHEPLTTLAAIENTLIACITLYSSSILLFSRTKFKPSLLTISCLAYSLSLSIVLALSTPALGTLFRYKVFYLPLVLIILVETIHKHHLSGKLSKH